MSFKKVFLFFNICLLINCVKSGTQIIVDCDVATLIIKLIAIYYVLVKMVAKFLWRNYVPEFILKNVSNVTVFRRLSRFPILSNVSTLKDVNF